MQACYLLLWQRFAPTSSWPRPLDLLFYVSALIWRQLLYPYVRRDARFGNAVADNIACHMRDASPRLAISDDTTAWMHAIGWRPARARTGAEQSIANSACGSVLRSWSWRIPRHITPKSENMIATAHSLFYIGGLSGHTDSNWTSSCWRSTWRISSISSRLETNFGEVKCRKGAVEEPVWRDKNCGCQYCTKSCSSASSRCQDNARLNDLVNQIRNASGSIDRKTLGWAQQLQTSKLELSRAQSEVAHCEVRWAESIYRNSRRRRSSNIWGKKILPCLATILGILPRLTHESST